MSWGPVDIFMVFVFAVPVVLLTLTMCIVCIIEEWRSK